MFWKYKIFNSINEMFFSFNKRLIPNFNSNKRLIYTSNINHLNTFIRLMKDDLT